MITGFCYRVLFLLIIASLCFPAVGETSGNPDNKPFLTSSISNTHPFVGQEILLTYTLYFRDIAPKISRETNPLLQGLWAKESEPDRFIKSIPATVQGEPLRSAIVKRFKLVPIQSGRITVSGYKMQCVLPQQSDTRERKELPDTSVQITAPTIVFSAHPLPEPVPAGFFGAVGNFSLNILADKRNLRIGDPLYLKLILTGTGNLLTVELPNLHLPESFRQNPPERTTALQKDSGLSVGSITVTIIAWPQSEGDFMIPALHLIVFNPETKQFNTLISKPLSITVTRAGQGARMNNVELFDTTQGKKKTFAPLFIDAAIAIVLLISGVVVVLIREKNAQNAPKKHLKTLAELKPDSDDSAEKMKQQLFAVLEEAGIKSPGCLTRRELKQSLQEIHITDENRTELLAMLDSLDRIMYTPAGEKQVPIPEGLITKMSALLRELKKAGRSH